MCKPSLCLIISEVDIGTISFIDNRIDLYHSDIIFNLFALNASLGNQLQRFNYKIYV